jgi:uncharacterized damage-inducible protein DinB
VSAAGNDSGSPAGRDVAPAAPRPEAWLRGPVSGVPAQLQPVAHALIQALEDVERLAADATPAELWTAPGGAATVGFHLRHMAGSLDRLLTYARGEALSEAQRGALAAEKRATPAVAADALLTELRQGVDAAVAQLRATPEATLEDARAVGRAGLPSSVRGLLYHAGEHTVRHAGQVVTSLRILRGPAGPGLHFDISAASEM